MTGRGCRCKAEQVFNHEIREKTTSPSKYEVVHFLPTISVNEMSDAHNQFANISPLSGDFDLLHSQSRKVVEKCRCCLGNHAENQGGSNTACAHHIDAVVLNKAELP